MAASKGEEQWLIEAFLQLASSQESANSNQEEILEELEEIKGRLQTLDAKLDEQTLRAARTGVRHLVDGANSDIDDMRSDEYLMARREFGKLVQLDPEGTTEGTSGCVDNKHLIAIGHWGNSYYFNIRGDRRNAAIQVYECTAKFPIVGLVLFSPHFFSKDYSTLISQAATEMDNLRRHLVELSSTNFWRNAWYYTKNGFVLVTAGVAGLATGAIAAALSAGPAAPVGGIMAKKVYDEIKVTPPILTDTKSVMDTVNELQQTINNYVHELENECNIRRAALQTLTASDLLALREQVAAARSK